MIYPKCLTGRAPQIAFDGQVYPCCWIQYKDKIRYESGKKENIFKNPEFNIYRNNLADILASTDYVSMLRNLQNDTPEQCAKHCDKFQVDKTGRMNCNNSLKARIDPRNESKEDWQNTLSSNAEIYQKQIIDLTTLDIVQLETSSRCSLACPACCRVKDKNQTHWYKDDLDLDVLMRSLEKQKIKVIRDCGRYGDPIFYKYYLDFIDSIKNLGLKKYSANIAATGKGLEYWKNLIDKFLVLKADGVEINIMFGIDGLKDTSKIYRVGQDFDEIFNAMIQCNDAGLNVSWQFIPNRYNEHQIDLVKEIAQKHNLKLEFALSTRWHGEREHFKPINPQWYT